MQKEQPFTPSKKVLEKYAQVLVTFALRGGKGIQKGDVVAVSASDAAKPLYAEVLRAIWQAGGHVIQRYMPSDESGFAFDRTFFECATDEQLSHFPKKYLKGLVDEADHSIFIIAETDLKALQGIDPDKIMRKLSAMKPYKEWRDKKESQGKFSWTVALYGTPHMAKEAKLSHKEYWGEIQKACFLDAENPVAKWKEVYAHMDTYIRKLNKLSIDKLHIEGSEVDLWVTLGKNRKWISGGGCNIPSFEIFTSPDWRGTEGWIRFNQPLYLYGNLVEGIELEFKNGVVIKSKAKKNEKVLKSMLATEGADKVGEFSLTDSRFSRITKFMAETLYDENVGGVFGNTHIALGSSYHDCLLGDHSKVTKGQWKKMGFNDSTVHTDIVSTTDRTVTAHLQNGKKKVIFEGGKFVL